MEVKTRHDPQCFDFLTFYVGLHLEKRNQQVGH